MHPLDYRVNYDKRERTSNYRTRGRQAYDDVKRHRLYSFSKKSTNRTYSIVEGRISPGGGSSPHIQKREYEGFYVLDGELVFNVEGKQVISKAGTVINIPPNVIHSFKNHTDNIVRVLIVIAPAGMEKLFEEVGTEVFDINIAKTSSPSDEEKKRLLEMSKKYGVEILQ